MLEVFPSSHYVFEIFKEIILDQSDGRLSLQQASGKHYYVGRLALFTLEND